jgi:hypothetical protein
MFLPMSVSDDFSTYVADLLNGRYDCVDRIVLNGYFLMGQTSGGFLTWWNQLCPGAPLHQKRLEQMAGDFSRRLHAFAKKANIPVIYCLLGDKTKHQRAEKLLPKDPAFQGVFAILVARAPALIWKARRNREGKLVLRRQAPWPLVQHYHFHILDRVWGHLTIKMSGHPPFGVQVSLNGHEWVERQARHQSIRQVKEGNCFESGSDFEALDQLARGLRQPQGLGELAQVVDRWVYSACLCFGLDRPAQERSQFHYSYSCYQLEYSRNLLFQNGRRMDQIYQGLIERTRGLLDVPRLRTIFGRKQRPSRRRKSGGRIECVIEHPQYNLTVFKLVFGKLVLKIYDKGGRLLRIEVVVNNVEELRCGKRLEKLPPMLKQLERMVVDFLAAVQAAHLSYLDSGALDKLPTPSIRGTQRLAGVDLQKPRMQAVAQAVVALAPQPGGFTAAQLAQRLRQQQGPKLADYNGRRGAYDLRKLRGKDVVERVVIELSRRASESWPACSSCGRKCSNQCWQESSTLNVAVRQRQSRHSTCTTNASRKKCSPHSVCLSWLLKCPLHSHQHVGSCLFLAGQRTQRECFPSLRSLHCYIPICSQAAKN